MKTLKNLNQPITLRSGEQIFTNKVDGEPETYGTLFVRILDTANVEGRDEVRRCFAIANKIEKACVSGTVDLEDSEFEFVEDKVEQYSLIAYVKNGALALFDEAKEQNNKG